MLNDEVTDVLRCILPEELVIIIDYYKHRIPTDDFRYSMLLNKKLIKQVTDKYHAGCYGHYGEVVVKDNGATQTIFTSLPLDKKVLWSSYTWDHNQWNAYNQINFYMD